MNYMWQRLRQTGKLESFIVLKKCMCVGVGGSFRYALVGGHPHGDVGGKLTRSSTSYVIGFRNIFGFLCLVLRSRIKKNRETCNY